MAILSADPSPRIPQLGYVHFKPYRIEYGEQDPIYTREQCEKMMEELRDKHVEDITEQLLTDILLRHTGDKWNIVEIKDRYEDEKYKLIKMVGTRPGRLYGDTGLLNFLLIDPQLEYEQGYILAPRVPYPDSEAGKYAYLTDEWKNN